MCMCSCSFECRAPMRRWALRQNLEDSHGRWGQEESSGQKMPECSTRMWCNNLWFLLQTARCVVGFLLLFPFFSQVHKSNLSSGVMNGAGLWLEIGVASPSPLQHTSCRSVMQSQLCPEGLWGRERPQPDLYVCAIRIDLQGITWKAACLSACSGWSAASRGQLISLLWALGMKRTALPRSLWNFGGSCLALSNEVSGDHRFLCDSLVTAAQLFGVRAKQQGCSVQGHKCCSSGHWLL